MLVPVFVIELILFYMTRNRTLVIMMIELFFVSGMWVMVSLSFTGCLAVRDVLKDNCEIHAWKKMSAHDSYIQNCLKL